MQIFSWYIIYEDGKEVSEFNSKWEETYFKNIDKNNISKYGLLNNFNRKNRWEFDARTGVLNVLNNKIYKIYYENEEISSRSNIKYDQIIQYKHASSYFLSTPSGFNGNPVTTVINAHSIGWKNFDIECILFLAPSGKGYIKTKPVYSSVENICQI